jgi:hypothetical protein
VRAATPIGRYSRRRPPSDIAKRLAAPSAAITTGASMRARSPLRATSTPVTIPVGSVTADSTFVSSHTVAPASFAWSISAESKSSRVRTRP